MVTHGTIREFSSSQEDWKSYSERLQQYFTLNDIERADKQRAVLLSCVGASAYRLIRNLFAPRSPTELSFVEIVVIVQDHHQPPPSTIVQRFNFNSCYRQQGESISTFFAQLRKHSEFCKFKDSLNDMLRDRLVCGINDKVLQRRLLRETNVTFKQALDIALAQGAADCNAWELEQATPLQAMHDMSCLSIKGKGKNIDLLPVWRDAFGR